MLSGKQIVCTVFFALFLIISNSSVAQSFGIYVSPGIMNYGGDLQKKAYTFSQAEFAISGGLLYNFNHFTIRGSLTYGRIQGSDSTGGYKGRNLSFKSKLGEGNLMLQYDLFKLDEKKITPYIFAGAGLFYYNPYTFYNGKRVYLRRLGTEGQGLSIYPDRKPYSLTQFTIPVGLGVKYKITDAWQVALEFCSRFLFTDYLDDVSTTYPDETALLNGRGQLAVNVSFRGDELDPAKTFPDEGSARGNASRNDNYYTSALSIIYIFPNSDLFGAGRHKKMKSLKCPKL
ncbi:DUF6089 family protein [Parafilimonas sp.]|uniref:DUF6089 family protein n=1 Tax=Parafilimonas sp. TaxID=1969739 RepID=UPI0039E3BE11